MKGKALQSMSWYTFDIFFNRGAYFFVTLYLAKIIGPTEFGLASILGVIYYLGLAVSDSGMSNSLMRSKECDDTDYGTVLMTNLLFGLFIYILLLILAPAISGFYDSPKLITLLPIYGLGIVLSSLKSVYIAFMMKNFEYKRMFILNIPGNVVSIIVAVILSNYGFGIWSIVALFLSNQFVSLILFYLFSGWKTIFILNKVKFKFHFGFGYKLSISAFINTVFENIYQLIIGKYFSLRMTGIYDRAFTLGNYPISILSTVLSKVTLPIFVNYVDDIKLFREKFRETIKLVSFVSCFVTGLILIVVPFVIREYMGVEWIDSIRIFEILTLGLLFNPIHSMNLNILNVYGRSDIFLMLEVVKKVAQIFSIIICYQFGIIGLVAGFVGLSFFSLFVNLFYTQYFIKYSLFTQFLDIIPNIVAGFLSLILSKYFLQGQRETFFTLVIEVVLFVCVYYLLSFISNRFSFYYTKQIVISNIRKIYY